MKSTTKQGFFANPKRMVPLALAVMFFWGSLFPTIKLGYKAFEIDTGSVPSILLFAGVRFVLCGAILIAVTAFSKGGNRRLTVPRGRTWLYICLVALFSYTLHYASQYIGISHLPGSKTAILKQIGSLFIICFAFLFRKEDKFSSRKLAGGLLGFLSILVINLNGLQLSVSLYDALILAASFCSVAGTVCSKNAYDTEDPMTVTAWAQLMGGVFLLAAGLALGGRIPTFSWQAAGVMAYMCFASCMGYSLWNLLLKYHDISRLTVIKFSETLFSALVSWVLLGEDIFKLPYLVAFLLVCAGILVSSKKKKS